ncbi:DUF3833 family protein [Novosphingobium album (ex Liu et al. 2023)]|uniref:DUF3833 family protein n=1 Tax=Novosphingobium album (ex Liu et al. 2023) TaxID=3031130 RepID=A0ABT5WJN8_9SPHN|nr:DUF3833 family protein [Novosphingobium album (ex Liu et al. 2023)]MDE8650256.1 DUF3833 family protein [Novosphingobium album (ex Liu et al. 2023)]
MTALSCKAGLALSLTVVSGLALTPLRAETADHRAAPATTFDPVAFFTGATVGKGSLKKMMSSPQDSHVSSFGAMRRDGVLVLDQTVRIEGEAVKTRHWQLRPAGPGRFTGTISDAKGAVTAQVSGDRLTIRYTMTDGMTVDQVLTIAPGGQSARNAMKFRKFGIVAATLNETIRRE